MSLRFTDLVPDEDDAAAKRPAPRPASGPLSVYGFDMDAEPSPGPARADDEAPAPSPSIYGFHADPDALAGEFLDLAAGDEPEAAPAPTAAGGRAPAPVPTASRPAGELLAEVAAALDDGPALDDDDAAGGPEAGPGAEWPEGSWLDTPAGPATAPPVFATSKPTETVSAADVRPRPRAGPRPAPAPAPATGDAAPPPNAWGASTQEIAEELLKAVDEEKRGVSGSTEDDLAALLSAAIATSPERELPRRGGTAGPPLDPAHVPPGDFRAVAAGLIAELEASLTEPALPREEHP